MIGIAAGAPVHPSQDLSNPFQLRPEGYLSGRLHLIELYHMSTLVHVHIQHRTGAEQNMLHPVSYTHLTLPTT